MRGVCGTNKNNRDVLFWITGGFGLVFGSVHVTLPHNQLTRTNCQEIIIVCNVPLLSNSTEKLDIGKTILMLIT